MTKAKRLLIWWTTQQECETILRMGVKLPGYLGNEFSSRYGRNGRGRLWVDHKFGAVQTTDWPNTALSQYVGDLAGGIVFDAIDLRFLMDLPGIVTDLNVRRVKITVKAAQ